jgi:hypothetical protein
LEYFIFADESGTHTGSKCYGIGALCISESQLEELVEFVTTVKAEYRLDEEIKWTRIRKYKAAIEVALRIVDYVLDTRLPTHHRSQEGRIPQVVVRHRGSVLRHLLGVA